MRERWIQFRVSRSRTSSSAGLLAGDCKSFVVPTRKVTPSRTFPRDRVHVGQWAPFVLVSLDVSPTVFRIRRSFLRISEDSFLRTVPTRRDPVQNGRSLGRDQLALTPPRRERHRHVIGPLPQIISSKKAPQPAASCINTKPAHHPPIGWVLKMDRAQLFIAAADGRGRTLGGPYPGLIACVFPVRRGWISSLYRLPRTIMQSCRFGKADERFLRNTFHHVQPS